MGFRQWSCLAPFPYSPEVRPLPPAGVTRRPRYHRPVRHPAGPVRPSRATGLACARHRQGFPCCHVSHPACVPAPVPRRVWIGARVACFPIHPRPSPGMKWVGSRIAVCGACPVFTHVPARMVADRLCGPFGPGASNHVVASMIRPDCHHPKRQLLGGVRTRQGNAPFHGARMPSGYRHLTRHDRFQIQALGKSGLSQRAIAAEIGRSQSTVSRGTSRNSGQRGHRHGLADGLAVARRRAASSVPVG